MPAETQWTGYTQSTAPTSAADAGPYYAPPSGSTGAAENYAGAQDAYNRALIRFNGQRTGLLQQYGYKGTIDPTTGMMTNLGVDGGAMHGGLQDLLHNQALEDQNADYAAEDRGLHGGLAHQASSELHYQHGGQSSALVNALLSSLTGINDQQQEAKGTLNDALWSLTHDATTSAVDSGDYNPAAPVDDSATPTTVAANPRAKTLAKTYVQGSAGRGSQYAPPRAKPAPKKTNNAYNNNKNKRG